MVTPNYKPGVGRLVTDRFEFQDHVNGNSFNHTAPGVQLSPPVVIDGYSRTTVQDAIYAISLLPALIVPDASLTTKGLVKLSGDISGTGSIATDVRVSGLQGRAVTSLAPSTNQVLTWDGSVWKPLGIGNIQGRPISTLAPNDNQVLTWDGYIWKPLAVATLQGRTVSATTPSINNVLTWDGSSWGPSAVTTIQGRNVSSSTPNVNDVLTWNGSTWSPTNIPLQFSPGGDLDPASTNANQKVIGLTGLSSKVTCSASQIEFISSLTPILTQADTSSNGNAFYIIAQESTASAGVGGKLVISGGINNTTNGYNGGMMLKMNSTVGSNCMIDLTELAESPTDPHRRVLSLLKNTDQVTNSEMPNGTGDMVIYVANAATNPTANPVNGAIIYSNDGFLSARQRTGDDFKLGHNRIFYNNCLSVAYTGTSAHFNTTSSSYVWVTDGYLNITDNIKSGDIVNIQYSSSISSALTDRGQICFNVNYNSTDNIVTGSETYVYPHDGYAMPITIVSQYIMTLDSSSTRVGVQVKRVFGSGAGINIYAGMSLTVQIIRP
jgi:hypothetical protein